MATADCSNGLSAVLAELRAQEDARNYIYRGQTRRFGPFQWQFENSEEPLTVEGLLPNDYRFASAICEERPLTHREITEHRSPSRDVRDRFESSLEAISLRDHAMPDSIRLQGQAVFENTFPGASLGEFDGMANSAGRALSHWLGPMLLADAQRTQYLLHKWQEAEESKREEVLAQAAAEIDYVGREEHKTRKLWSLAQHYKCATALLDITWSIDVAAWFATNAWSPFDDNPTTGTGVIYRMDADSLVAFMNFWGDLMRRRASAMGDQPPPRPFLESCRDIPPDVALRPSAQHGGSIHGFDQPELLHHLTKAGIIEVFEFHHSEDFPQLALCRDDIMPQSDPFNEILNAYRHY